MLATTVLAGCSGLDPVATYEQITDPAQLYMQLTIDHRAVSLSTVAPYDTLQLTATPRDARGEPMTGLPAPIFYLEHLSDSTSLRVTPEGLLQALDRADEVHVVAELAGPGNVKHTDAALVKVTNDPPPRLASLSFDPVPPDSAKVPIGVDNNAFDGFLLPFSYLRPRLRVPRAQDAGGNLISGLPFEYTALDPVMIEIDRFSNGTATVPAQGRRPGQVGVVVRTTAYGVTMADTLPVTVTWPVVQSVQVVTVEDGTLRFQPDEIRIPPYGMVLWQNQLGDTVDVTFEDPTKVALAPATICDKFLADESTYGPGLHCGTGNAVIPGLPTDVSTFFPLYWTEQLRQFPVPGMYRYHSTRTGATGRVVVADDPNSAVLP